jgi:hypothetical protein
MLRLLTLCLLVGCPKDDTGSDPETDAPPSLVEISDAQGAAITMSLNAETVRLASGQDATIDWSALTMDLMQRSIDPAADITDAKIYHFQSLEPQEILAGFATDELSQSDVSFIVSCEPQDMRCDLEDFVTMGHQFIAERDFVEGHGRLMLELVGDPALGPLAMAFLQPATDSDAHLYAMDDDASTLRFELDLASAEAIAMVPGTTPTLDWSALTQSGQGGSIDPEDLDRVEIFRFEQASQAEDLLGWADAATARWSLDCDGATVELTALEGDTEFTGIDVDGAWLLAITCSRCNLPVPRFVASLEPTG